ncbi:MAG: (deoxy)nucleoside triphosphate pyrophosphohydrolase [Thermodesulfobacteriota bacterium]
MSAPPQPPQPPLQVTCGLIRRGELVLVARRADNRLWELPGGKQRPGEDLRDCLVRELAEELGVTVRVRARLAVVRQAAPERPIDLHCFTCELVAGEPRPLEHLELSWVTPAQMLELDLCPLDRQLARQMLALSPAPAA